jgi:hypothetical protein
MRKTVLRRLILAHIGLALLTWLGLVGSPAAARGWSPEIHLQATASSTTEARTFIPKTWTPTPHPTLLINLPMVQQDASRQESQPEEETEATPPPTPSPTPIPPQTSAENAPIVVGALLIVSIIVLAWLFLGRKSWLEDG